MSYTRRNTNKDATWARAWTADTYADLASIAAIIGTEAPHHGDIAYVSDMGIYFLWLDNNTWAPLYLVIPIVPPIMIGEENYSEDIIVPASLNSIGGEVLRTVVQDNITRLGTLATAITETIALGTGTTAVTLNNSTAAAVGNIVAVDFATNNSFDGGLSVGAQIKAISMNAAARDTVLTFSTRQGSGALTESFRIAADQSVQFGKSVDGNVTPITIINTIVSSAGSSNETVTFPLSWYDAVSNVANGTTIVAGKSGDYTIGANANSYLAFSTTSANSLREVLRLDLAGNALLGTSSSPTGTASIVLADGTAPSSLATNTAGLYVDDVNGTVEQFAINENNDPSRLTGLTARNSAQFDKTTNTTLATVTGLSRNVAAGITYRFEAVLHIDADVTGGSKFAISGTATATSIIYHVLLIDNNTNLNTITSRQTALGGSVGQAGTTAGLCIIRGTITVNAAGTLLVQFAQNVSNGTSSVLANSTFKIEQVP